MATQLVQGKVRWSGQADWKDRSWGKTTGRGYPIRKRKGLKQGVGPTLKRAWKHCQRFEAAAWAKSQRKFTQSACRVRFDRKVALTKKRGSWKLVVVAREAYVGNSQVPQGKPFLGSCQPQLGAFSHPKFDARKRRKIAPRKRSGLVESYEMLGKTRKIAECPKKSWDQHFCDHSWPHCCRLAEPGNAAVVPSWTGPSWGGKYKTERDLQARQEGKARGRGYCWLAWTES